MPEDSKNTIDDDDVNIDDIDISELPDDLPTENVKGLKSAFGKVKQQLSEVKQQLSDYKNKANLVDQLISEGINPDEVPERLSQLKKQQELEQQLQKMKAELQAEKDTALAQAQKQHAEELSSYQAKLNQAKRQKQVEKLFAIAGGSLDAYDDFELWANQYVEFDENNEIKSFKKKGGDILYVEDEKNAGKVRPATAEDFIVRIKAGDYGKALQNTLPAYNQASGAGLPGSAHSDGTGKIVLRKSQMANIGKLTPEQLKKIQEGQYILVD